jgi:hypothetical protein
MHSAGPLTTADEVTRMRTALFACLLVLPLGAAADPLAVGSVLSAVELRDQHAVTRAIDSSTRAMLFGRDMDGGKVLKGALEPEGAALLERAGAVYVADVSRMPSLIRRIFAYPSLRRRGYPILLDEEGSITASFPGEDGKGTLMRLDRLRLVSVEQFETAEALRAALETAMGPQERSAEP